jgi:hypothetical protein
MGTGASGRSARPNETSDELEEDEGLLEEMIGGLPEACANVMRGTRIRQE